MFSFSWSIASKKAFTLVELIVVITILAILAAVGFVIMSHQTSVARDGKRISEIQSLSSASRITTAQLRELPRPIADSLELTVSGAFIGYQWFMSKSLVNPIGYGSDKIYDPLDGIPYTYRVNKNYDQAQFMAYLENPRFERSIEIALQSLPSLVSEVSALDTSSIDFSKKYPYAIGDKLWIFIDKNTRTPLQSGVTGTGSRDISLSDSGSIDIIIGSNGDDSYVSTKISNSVLTSLVDGSFGNNALLAMNTNTPENNSTSYILTMGEYSIMGNTYYGYVGPLAISVYASLWVNIVTITPGSLVDDTVNGYVIDTFILDSNYQAPLVILAGSSDMPSSITFETPYANISCTPQSSFLDVTPYSCNGSTTSTDFPVWSQHELEITLPAPPPPEIACTNPGNVTDASYFTFNSSTQTITGYDWVNGPKSIVIPCNIWWLNVKHIGNSAFREYALTSIEIPSTAITIGHYAFYGNQITSVTIPDWVTTINPNSFQTNTIASVSIPNTVTYIGSAAFAQNQLTSVVIPDSVTDLAAFAFNDNQITSIAIPAGITQLSGWVFSQNQITSVTIPNNIIHISNGAFAYNQLTSITLPNSIESIGPSAFIWQTSSLWNGTVYGPASGPVKNAYAVTNYYFDNDKLPNYVDLP